MGSGGVDVEVVKGVKDSGDMRAVSVYTRA
jgi:hypothetical protein